MKALAAAIVAALTLAATVPATAQSHRHTPSATIQATINTYDDTATDTAGMEAVSDTTDTVDVITATSGQVRPPIDDILDHDDFAEAVLLPISIMLIIFVLAPVGIIGIIIYFILKSRKQKIQLAELAMRNGQPIPSDTLNSSKAHHAAPQKDYWTQGIQMLFIGLGLIAMFAFMGWMTLVGVGAFVAIYGAGQMVIAKTTQKKETAEEPLPEQPAGTPQAAFTATEQAAKKPEEQPADAAYAPAAAPEEPKEEQLSDPDKELSDPDKEQDDGAE